MIQQTSKLTVSRLALASVCWLWLAGCTGNVALGPDAVKGQAPDGFVEMHEVQAAFMGSGSGGAGSLSFRGGQYAFEVGGVGVGGIGLSTSRQQVRCITSATSGSSPAPMARPATALRLALRALAISGCRTRRA